MEQYLSYETSFRMHLFKLSFPGISNCAYYFSCFPPVW